MKTVVSLLFACLFLTWGALSVDAQEQVKDRAKLIEEAKKEGQGFRLRLLQRFGRQSVEGGVREKISIHQHGIL
jgi:hypothetical protein